ncbi:unnamed protein product [Rotaria magnacalcarata]|uniref:Diablo homolog, mitochondrial n=2 Tax=Rotaria magnacalcarata TaxID=392030 RepID=A0A8S2U7L0_9BILA|nr:unnamed protein product [Rotaria magnacalcarata]
MSSPTDDVNKKRTEDNNCYRPGVIRYHDVPPNERRRLFDERQNELNPCLKVRKNMFRFHFRLRSPLLALASSAFFGYSSSKESKVIPVQNPSELPRTPYQHVNCTGFECVRESSMINLSASSSFLKHALYYYSELTQHYCVHISTMIGLLEEYKRREGAGSFQQEIWDIYVQHRVSLGEMKTELLRLRLLLSTIDRLVTESIDASYQTQDETVTQLVSNELIQTKRIIEQNEQLISKTEMSLTTEQVKIIEKNKDTSDTKASDE